MIKARPARWAKFIFHLYIMNLLKRSFHAFHLAGTVPEVIPDAPILVLPNHSTWWDGFFVYYLNSQLFQRPMYLMMLASQLKKYHFFSRVGAYGIDSNHISSLRESLTYTIELMQQKSPKPPLICIFPQGELLPWGKRPLNFKPGIEWIIKKYGKSINLVPLAMRIEFCGEQKPEVFFRFGGNYFVNAENFSGMPWLKKVNENLLAELEQQLTSGDMAKLLLARKLSVNQIWDKLRGRN